MEYFVTFSDNLPTPPRQARLYMDCDFQIEPGADPELTKLVSGHNHPLAYLSILSNLTVTESHVTAAGAIVIRLGDDVVFTVINRPALDDPQSHGEWRMTQWFAS
ncbi:hypothetical protein [Planotetraspora kaengkrachanensis]|uniref:hypothetical protein n=1 Tax=Planotetraspora kaengkrachanensis TaxID=575193 RepID=UPI001940F6E1|nr:hypothetical protein [Planotetraspora kaengkrachanensis]